MGKRVDNVRPISIDFQHCRRRTCAWWLQQMWTDLGRLDIAEILQIRPSLGGGRVARIGPLVSRL